MSKYSMISGSFSLNQDLFETRLIFLSSLTDAPDLHLLLSCIKLFLHFHFFYWEKISSDKRQHFYIILL